MTVCRCVNKNSVYIFYLKKGIKYKLYLDKKTYPFLKKVIAV